MVATVFCSLSSNSRLHRQYVWLFEGTGYQTQVLTLVLQMLSLMELYQVFFPKTYHALLMFMEDNE